jgi:hypothetical protein
MDRREEDLISRLDSIEFRLSRLESALSLPDNNRVVNIQENELSVNETTDYETTEESRGLESQFGSFGLAWMGNIILFVGIAILVQYQINLGNHFISVILGYLAAGLILYLSVRLNKTNSHLSNMFRMNSVVLLFYATLRLHFFSNSPVIQNKTLAILFLIPVIIVPVYLAIRNRSGSFAFISVLFAIITAIAGDSTHFTLPLLTLTAVLTGFYYIKFAWKPLMFVSAFLLYITYFLWLFGNPMMGHPMQMLTDHHYGVIYLFGIGACYSAILLIRNKDGSSDDFMVSFTILSGVLFTLLLSLVSMKYFSSGYVVLFSVITVFCLLYSALLHSRSEWNFGSAYFALYGFMAMSIALYGLFGFPRVYFLLSIQSLIVISMALWFRNRLMVLMNSLLFLTIFLAYYFFSKPVNEVNFSFAVISLVTARIINWQKSRLQIKTEFIRNLYLVEGFFIMLYAIYHAVPKNFITLSWTLTALLYFLLSLLLRNPKYRYMALGTMICAALYLFIVDLASIEIIYRVLALMTLAAISIGISMYYSRRMKKS